MSSREQYRQYNISLKKSVKTLEDKLTQEQAYSGSLVNDTMNYRKIIQGLQKQIKYLHSKKIRLVWFIWGISAGMTIMLLIDLLSS